MNTFPFDTITVIDEQHPLNRQVDLDRELSTTLKDGQLIVRFWQAQGVILGKMDTVTSRFTQGLDFLDEQGQDTLIRKAGGLAVVCDDGILNLSLIFSKHHPLYGGLNEAYGFGVEFLRTVLSDLDLPIEDGEISASYCPGKYDLSVNGQKFCGMAQYRTKDAVMLMMTLCVSGNQAERCALIEGFYSIANPDLDPRFPQIDPNVMETLEKLSDRTLTVPQLKTMILAHLSEHGTSVKTSSQM